MKRQLLLNSFFCILIGILLSSCGTHMSITKRHYNKGYYIANSNDKQIASKTVEKKAPIYQTTPSLYTIRAVTDESTLNGNTTSDPQSQNGSLSVNLKKKTATPVSKQTAKHNHRKVSLREPVSIQKDQAKVKKPAGDTQRNGLSLFWLIILVILILWAIGFLAGGFGLGGLINLLLLIALILLILWLLRIV